MPPGRHYVCAAVNTTALVNVDKTVIPADAADPSDFQFPLAADPPVIIPDPQVHELPPGQDRSVVPNQSSTLDEIAVPDVQLTGLTCESGSEPKPIDDLVLLPGATATCSATNTFGPPTVPTAPPPPAPGTMTPGPARSAPGALPSTGMPGAIRADRSG